MSDGHAQSMEMLRNGTAFADLIGEAFPVVAEDRWVRVVDVELVGPAWWDPAVSPRLAYQLAVGIEVGRRGEIEAVERRSATIGLVPALMDPESTDHGEVAAWREGAEIPLIGPSRQYGLYWGRPLVPVAQLIPAGGARLAKSSAKARPSLILVPRLGPVVELVVSDADARVRRGFGSFESAVGGPRAPRLQATVMAATGQSTDPAIVAGRAMQASLSGVFPDLPPEFAWADLVDAVRGVDRKASFGDGLSTISELRVRPFGTLLAEEIVILLRRAAFQALAGGNERIVAQRMHISAIDRLERRMGELVRGREGEGAVVIGSEWANSVVRLQQRAQVTRFGPGGLPHPLRGRAELRELDPAWRGTICPLQTPESPDVGLVRFFSTGYSQNNVAEGSDEWGDLSLAASLIPYVGHNDPARSSIASKNLKQAVPPTKPSPALIETAGYTAVAEQGVVRAGVSGQVREVGDGLIVTTNESILFGPALPLADGSDPRWRPSVGVGDRVVGGQIVASAPDVVVNGAEARFAPGLDALVAYTPWEGMNFEDAVVVSAAFASRATGTHIVTVAERLNGRSSEIEGDIDLDWLAGAPVYEQGRILVSVGDRIEAGSALAEIVDSTGLPRRSVFAPWSGQVVWTTSSADAVSVRLSVERPISVGDKLTNRHGGKAVISAILAESEMPRVVMPDGGREVVDVLMNPLGVFRRLNVGQLVEAHRSLLALLAGEERVVVGRTEPELEEIGRRLAELGAPDGRLLVESATGDEVGRVVVGLQHLVFLDHLAEDKRSERNLGPRALRDGQPSRGGRRVGGEPLGGSQRMGEMEIWALEAVGASALLADLLEARGRGSTLRSIQAHLAVAGLRLVTVDETGDGMVDALELDSLHRAGRRFVVTALDMKLEPFPVVSGNRRASELAGEALSDKVHGGFRGAQCACGIATLPGSVCAVCGDVARRRALPERSELRFEIPLPVPISHPWAKKGDDRGVDSPLLSDLKRVPILPPAFRGGEFEVLDREYLRLVKSVEKWTGAESDSGDRAAALRSMKRAVTRIMGRPGDRPSRQTIWARLDGKQGLLRRGLLGRNANWSGRGVITPDLTLGPEDVGLPKSIMARLGVGSNSGSFEDVVVVNRQPSAHPYNLVALRAREVGGNAIRLHPLVLSMIGGDFDGDTVAVHRPQSAEALEQAWRLLRPAVNQRSSRIEGAVLTKRDLDIALGLTLLSSHSEGLSEIEKACGLKPSGPIDSSTINGLFDAVIDRHDDPDERVVALDRLIRLALAAAVGWSCGLIELLPYKLDDLPDSHPLAVARRAGAAGKDGGLRQLLEGRGRVEGMRPDPQGTRYRPVEARFREGLGPEDYYVAAAGGMAKLSEKKLTAPVAGALSKMLVDIAYDVVLTDQECAGAAAGVLECRVPLPGVCQKCHGPDPRTGLVPPLGHRAGILAAMLIGERGLEGAMKTFHAGGTNVGQGGRIRELAGAFGSASGRSVPVIVKEGFGSAKVRYDDPVTRLVDPIRVLLQASCPDLDAQIREASVWTLVRNVGRKIRPGIAARLQEVGVDSEIVANLMADPPSPLSERPPTRAAELIGARGRAAHAGAMLEGEVDARHVEAIMRGLLHAAEAGRWPDGGRPLSSIARRRGDPLVDAAVIGDLREMFQTSAVLSSQRINLLVSGSG